MSLTPSCRRQWDSTWNGLPAEIRLLILEALVQDGCAVGRLATVSREWQATIERHNFARIKLTPFHLIDFSRIIRRNRDLVRYIWLCVELDEYDCIRCAPAPELLSADEYSACFGISLRETYCITGAFESLFSALSTWPPANRLTLDISVYSPSDSRHWFKYLTFIPDSSIRPQTRPRSSLPYNDHSHGWADGARLPTIPRSAIDKVFHAIMDDGPFMSDEDEREWWDQLPSVPAVSRLLLRQQNRRRWKPDSLAHMFARLPRLEEIHYEPWREWCFIKYQTDYSESHLVDLVGLVRPCLPRYSIANSPASRCLEYQYLLRSIQLHNKRLKRLVVFENFNQQYPTTLQRFADDTELTGCDSFRSADPAVSRMIALTSLRLEHFSASFIADASYFFAIGPSWKWPRLVSLVITSKSLHADADPAEIGAVLRAAAVAALKMPRLQTMEIWNGRKGLAALFKYEAFRDARRATLTWRGTWNLALEPSITRAWETVIREYDAWRLDIVQEWLDKHAIKSHADAIHCLRLSGQVIRPSSLKQIWIEQNALEGLATV